MTEKFGNKAAAFVALSDVQSKFGVLKSHQNEMDYILKELKPLLMEHQAAVYFNEKLEAIGERIYVHSTAHFVCQGYEILATGMAREEERTSTKRGAATETGVAIIDARKCALNSLFLISEESVDPNSNYGISQSQLANQNQVMNTQTHIQDGECQSAQSTMTSSTNESSVVSQKGMVVEDSPQAEKQSVSACANTSVSEKHAPTPSASDVPQDSSMSSDILKRGIEAAIRLGADEEDVYIWKHEMEPGEAIRVIAEFVRSKQEQMA
ncbi:TPA: ERF family protein [Streptococcus suis]